MVSGSQTTDSAAIEVCLGHRSPSATKVNPVAVAVLVVPV